MGEYENREYYLSGPQRPRLFMQSWVRKNSQPRGCVLITHGLAEHSECYEHVAQALCDQNWTVFAWDMQGHGKSEGRRGYVENFQYFVEDLIFLIDQIKEDESLVSTPFHLVGHSMGGLVTLLSLLHENKPRIDKVALSNPALGLAFEVPKIKEMSSHWLNQFWPTFTMNNQARPHILTRDPEVRASYKKDPLRHSRISAPLFLGMIEAQNHVKANSFKFNQPILFQIGGSDKLIDPQTSLNVFKEMGELKKLKLYEESFHEIYNDLNRQETIHDLVTYLGEDNGNQET